MIRYFIMELRHLRYFCAVAEHGSFTTAARQLNVSQSGVSGQVRDLENEIGVSLLRRNQREVTLTAEGSIFFQEAREILIRADRAVELAVRSSSGVSGTLTVGLCGPATAAFLPKLIRKFRKQFPGVRVALRELTPSEQIEALLNGHIDIAFTRGISAESKALISHELFIREPLVVALPKGHPLTSEQTVALSRLAKERLILWCREGAPEVFDSIVAMCKRAKFSPRIGDTPRSWQSILTMVEADEGVAIVPSAVQYLRADDVVFRPLTDKRCKVDAIIAWRRNESSPVRDSFLELLRAKGAELQRINERS
jgi:DNA-binding transcriptional LysR family regulator